MSWDDVALHHGTDKASSHHDYARHYERLLADHKVERLLEIGVAHGKSLFMWRELFPDALIVGVDIVPECRLHQRRDIAVLIADAADPAMMAAVSTLHGPFNVVVDDGEHDERTVRAAFEELYPRMAAGGVYLIEDLSAAEPWVSRFVEDWQIDIVPVDDHVGQIPEPCLLVKHRW